MRNRTAAQIQKENLYGVGEVRLFSVGFQQFIYNISKKRDAKKLNRVFSHPLFVYIMICLISGFDCLEVFVFVADTFDMHRQISDFSIADCAAQVFSDLIADGLCQLKCLWKFDFHVVV